MIIHVIYWSLFNICLIFWSIIYTKLSHLAGTFARRDWESVGEAFYNISVRGITDDNPHWNGPFMSSMGSETARLHDTMS